MVPLWLLLAACGDDGAKVKSPDSLDELLGRKPYQSEDSVRAVYDNYKSAILNDRGEEAVEFVDSRTIAYYDKIIELVKTADSSKLETLSLLDKFMVLIVRYRTSKEDILAFDGNELLIYAINSGMVGKSSVANNTVGEVTIVDEFATGEFVSNGQKSPFDFHFYYEGGRWKLDLTSIFAVSDTAFKQVIEQSGMSENEFLFTTMESLGDTRVSSEIWHPVVK